MNVVESSAKLQTSISFMRKSKSRNYMLNDRGPGTNP